MEILSKTNMIDYVIDIRKQLYPNEDIPEEMKDRRTHVLAELTALRAKVDTITKIMNDDDVMKQMENMRDSKALIGYLETTHNVSELFLCVICFAFLIFKLVLFKI